MSRRRVGETFDYIVVGAGSSGCVVAARLSEDPGSNVLLLEAGGQDDHLYLKMPLAFLKAMPDPRFNWTYWTEPEPHLDGRRMPLPRGQGHRRIGLDQRHVRDARASQGLRPVGADGRDRLVVRRRAAVFPQVRGFLARRGPYHGAGGPVHVRPIDSPYLLHDEMMATAEAAGFRDQRRPRRRVPRRLRARRADRRPQGPPGQRGDRLSQAGDGAAQSRRALGRAGPQAGVRGQALRRRRDRRTAAQPKVVRARREVIVSGGTYNSPHLLMLSGIGPAAHLRDHGIAVVHDSPGVGRNLQEHPDRQPRIGTPRSRSLSSTSCAGTGSRSTRCAGR